MVQFSMSLLPARFPRPLLCLLSALTLGLVAGCASAQIVVQPEQADGAGSIQAWCDHHVPVAYRLHDRVVVRLMNDDEMTAYLHGDDGDGRQTHQDSPGDTDDIDGIFEDGPPRISLRVSGGAKPDMFTFAHEYGHYVWFHVLSKADRRRYESIYDVQRDAHHLVTEYATSSLQEGFAEAFSFYIVEPAILNHRDPQSGAFFAQFTAAHQPAPAS